MPRERLKRIKANPAPTIAYEALVKEMRDDRGKASMAHIARFRKRAVAAPYADQSVSQKGKPSGFEHASTSQLGVTARAM